MTCRGTELPFSDNVFLFQGESKKSQSCETITGFISPAYPFHLIGEEIAIPAPFVKQLSHGDLRGGGKLRHWRKAIDLE